MGAAGIAAAAAGWKLWCKYDVHRKNRGVARGKTILILGAGFGGLNTARELARLLPREDLGRILLVDQNNYLLFTPMLAEVASGELDPLDIVASPRRLTRRIEFQQGWVESIDLKTRTVHFGEDSQGKRRALHTDQLVIALGSVSNFHGIPGLEEHSLSMKSVGDAEAIRNRVLATLELANWEEDSAARREILTFVVGGGGFTGVETMAALNDLARETAKEYPRISPDDITTYLIHHGERLLEELPADLAAFTHRKLEERGVRVLLKTKIAAAGSNFIAVEGGRRIGTRTIIWAGGVAPNPLIETLDCQRGRHGGIAVDACCAVPDRAGVWAIGDCAEIPKPDGKGTYAPTAQNATREGALVARNIVAALCGAKPKPFTFEAIGELALVGRHAGVAQIWGVQFSGLPAWAMWRAIYLSKMPGMAQRSRILLDWMLDFAFGRNIAEVAVHEPRTAATTRLA